MHSQRELYSASQFHAQINHLPAEVPTDALPERALLGIAIRRADPKIKNLKPKTKNSNPKTKKSKPKTKNEYPR